MADAPNVPTAGGPAAYHLILVGREATVLASALRLLIDDVAHETQIRALARGVLEHLPRALGADDHLTVPLSQGELKVTYSAAALLVKDLGREEADERQVAQRVLDKLPDEHSIRAIDLASSE